MVFTDGSHMKSYPQLRPTRSTTVRPGRSTTRALPGPVVAPLRLPKWFKPFVKYGSALPAAALAWEAWKYYQQMQEDQARSFIPQAGWVLIQNGTTRYCPNPPPTNTWQGPDTFRSAPQTSCGSSARFYDEAHLLGNIGQIIRVGSIDEMRVRWWRYRTATEVNYSQHSTWQRAHGGTRSGDKFVNGAPHIMAVQPFGPIGYGSDVPIPSPWIMPGWFAPPIAGKLPWKQYYGSRGFYEKANPTTEKGNDLPDTVLPDIIPLNPPRSIAFSGGAVRINDARDRHKSQPPPRKHKEKKTRARKIVASMAMIAFAMTEAQDLLDIAFQNINPDPRRKMDRARRFDEALEMASQMPSFPKLASRNRLEMHRMELQRAIREYSGTRQTETGRAFDGGMDRVAPMRKTGLGPEPKPARSNRNTRNEYVARNWDHVQLDSFVQDVILNQVEDAILGRLNAGANKFLSKNGTKPYAPAQPWFQQ